MEAVEVPSGWWQTSTTNTCWATFTTQKLFKILPITTVDYNHPFLRCVCPEERQAIHWHWLAFHCCDEIPGGGRNLLPGGKVYYCGFHVSSSWWASAIAVSLWHGYHHGREHTVGSGSPLAKGSEEIKGSVRTRCLSQELTIRFIRALPTTHCPLSLPTFKAMLVTILKNHTARLEFEYAPSIDKKKGKVCLKWCTKEQNALK